ncbi:MAG: hypothetical protein WA364_03705 [Candidatus Nitrosopolaris sp.]
METELASSASFFKQVCLKTLDQTDNLDLNNICIKLDELNDLFETQKSEIKSKINLTGKKLLSKDSVDLILKAIPNDQKTAVKTQTEYINHWLAKLLICQNVILQLLKNLKFEYKKLIYNYEKYKSNDITDTPDRSRILDNCIKIQRKVYGLCQNIGICLYDYKDIYLRINRYLAVKESEFIPSPEFTSPYGQL